MTQGSLLLTPPRQPSEAGAAEKSAAADWQAQVLEAIDYLSRARVTFTADDLRHHCKWRGIGEPHDSNCWGAVVKTAAKAGTIRKVGYQESEQEQRKGGVIAVWERG